MIGKQIIGTELDAILIQEYKLKEHSQKTINSYTHHVKKFIESGK